MARDFFDASARARDVFAEASEAISLDLAALCFGDDARLDLTEYTQPALVTAELAMLRVLEAELGLRGAYFGGHSVGEYAALCAAGVVSLADAVRLTRRRGALMQAAVPPGHGAMLAVIADGIADRDLGELCRDVDVANRNSPDQIVLSGAADALARASAQLEALLASVEHRLVPLNVSAPFHSRMMRGIEAPFAASLAEVEPRLTPAAAARVTSNVSGGFHVPRADAITDALVRQLAGSVDWIANMRALTAVAARIIEVGPGRPLRNFFKAAGRDVVSIVSFKSAAKELG
jgi:[acyl-carrier-protein] S-malonyltransferase/trans-AT polyketide synthase/acyltransferase/oxidoreductase domain-containing protein